MFFYCGYYFLLLKLKIITYLLKIEKDYMSLMKIKILNFY